MNSLKDLNAEYWRILSSEYKVKFPHGAPCQCGTENVIEKSKNPVRMRSYLLMGALLNELLKPKRSNFENEDLAVLPRIESHGGFGEMTFSWMCFANRGYDLMIDWDDVDVTLKIILDGLLEDPRYNVNSDAIERCEKVIAYFLNENLSGDSYGDCMEHLKPILRKQFRALL